jgi:hydroxycarboxylate dehydrogenase B
MPIFTADQLTQICRKVFHAFDVPDAEAAVVTQSMVDANLVGHDSHGVIHLPKYVDELENALVQPGAEITVKRESPSIAVLDGNWGFGPVIATHAVKLAVQKAKMTDISSVAVSRSNEIRRLGGYLLIAAEAGMIGIMTVNDHGGGQAVAPFGGIEARLSTNPLACAIPVEGREPILLDMSTSVVASGKVRLKKHRNEPAPEGWILDAAGNPTTNVDDYYGPPPGALLPFGGIAAHKGFGLSVLVEILSGALTGAGCSREAESRVGNGFFITVINVASFVDPPDFTAVVEQFIAYLKSSKLAPGVDDILMPGERGFRERARRCQEGIFVEDETWAQILAIGQKYHVDLP